MLACLEAVEVEMVMDFSLLECCRNPLCLLISQVDHFTLCTKHLYVKPNFFLARSYCMILVYLIMGKFYYNFLLMILLVEFLQVRSPSLMGSSMCLSPPWIMNIRGPPFEV